MSDTLAQLITKVQGRMGDSGTIFTTAICTNAIREALKTFNIYAPINSGTLIDAVSEQHEYELSDSPDAASAISIYGVWLQDPNNTEHDEPLVFDAFNEDERLFFRLRFAQQTGETLIVRFTQPHTVNGLDSSAESTLPTWQNEILVTGAAAEAALIRARARIETINLSANQSANYKAEAKDLRAEFLADLTALANKRPPAVGEPSPHAWNDSYHTWDQ